MLRAAKVASTTRERISKTSPPPARSLATKTTTVTLEETNRAIALCSRTYRSRQVTISTRAGPTTGRMTEEACAQIAARLGVISDMAADCRSRPLAYRPHPRRRAPAAADSRPAPARYHADQGIGGGSAGGRRSSQLVAHEASDRHLGAAHVAAVEGRDRRFDAALGRPSIELFPPIGSL